MSASIKGQVYWKKLYGDGSKSAHKVVFVNIFVDNNSWDPFLIFCLGDRQGTLRCLTSFYTLPFQLNFLPFWQKKAFLIPVHYDMVSSAPSFDLTHWFL